MAVSKTYETLWSTAVLFIILPHLNQGLLSDYKICGDSGCESPMSRVLAIRDYHGKDCRFLSFRRGDTIFVYHKLTGKRDDLWAGSIDKQFGYFPKDAVKEEQVHATTEKIVETQDFDFFCMDEFGSIIDSSHLDSDDGAAADNDENIQIQESEIPQTTLNINDTKTESPSKPDDVITELPVSAQEADGTSTEVDKNKVASDSDVAAGTHKEAQETSLTQNEQGGSSSSAWLSSSVTGWLGLATEEGEDNLVEGVRKDEKKETQAKASFTSSVTGWLGFGGEGESDDAVKNSEEDNSQSADSFTSTMTGWLGFGEEKKTDPSTEKEHDDEKENEKDQEPAETFRSRRMSLDLEGSQLHEEKEEMGTLGWLGNRLSNNLGFGKTEGEAEETIQEEKQPQSSSWFDMGIRDILGFRGETSKDDERTGSSLKETEEDKPLEQFTVSENVDTSQSQPALTEEVSAETSNESEMEETSKDQNVSAETETEPGITESVSTDSNKNGLDTSDSSKDSVLSEDAAPEVDQKDISPQNNLKEESQAVDGMSSVLYSFFQTGSEEKAEDVLNDKKKETNVLDGEISAEMGDKDHLMPKSIENVGEDKNPETAAEDIKDASGTDRGFLTESGINLAPNFSSVDLNLNSTEHSAGKVEEDKTENEVEERDGITHQSDNTVESPDSLVKNDAGGDDREGEGNSAETDVPQREIYASQTDDSSEHGPAHSGAEENGGESQLYLSSDTASTEDDMLTAYNEDTDLKDSSLESLAIIGINSEAEMHHAELGQEGEGHPVEGSSTEFGSSNNTEIISENETEDRGTFSTSESTIQMEDNPDQDLLSLHMPSDAHMPEEIGMETEEDRENNLHSIHTETAEMEEHILSESSLRSAVESEKEIEQVEEMRGEIEEKEVEAQEKQQEVKEEKLGKLEEFKEEKKQETEEIMNEGKQVVEDTKKEEETQGREEEIKVAENVMALETQQEMEEEKQGKVEELEKKGIQEETEELKMEEKQEVEVVTKEGENQGEEEKLRKEEDIMAPETQQEMEEEKQEKVEELKEEGTHEEIEALKEEEKQEAQEGAKEDESQREMKEEILEEVEWLKEDEEQQQIEELQEEKQDNVRELTEDKRGEDLKEVEEENENERSVDDEKQVQLSLFEPEMENTDRTESASNNKEMQHELGLESVLSETPTLTENPLMEDQTTEEETKQTGKVEEEMDELKEKDIVEKQEMEDVKGERRDQEEEGELKCSNELCPQAGKDGFVRDGEENDSLNRLSSIEEGEIETETQNPLVDNDHILTDGTEVSQEVPSESAETDEGRKQEEEKRHDDAKAGEGEKENSESSFTGNEDIKSNNANSISDYNTLGVNQIKQSDCTDNDPLCLGESGQNNLPDHIILGQTAENKDDNQLSSKEAINADVSDDNTLLQGENTEPDNAESNSKETEQIYSDHKKRKETGEMMNEEKQEVEEDTKEEETQGREEEIKVEENVMALETQQETEEEKQEVEEMTGRNTDREKIQINWKHDDVTLNEDVQMKINDDNTVSTEFRAEAGIEISVSSDGPDKSQAVTSEQVAPDVSQHATGSSLLSDDHNKGKAKTESGAFGLLKNAFRFFSETSDTESTESASSLDFSIDETSVAQDPLTPEQESDLTTDSTQVHIQGLHTESPITLSRQQQQQQQPSPPPIPQTSSPSLTQNLSHPSSHSPNTASPLQTKILSRHYKNLLSYMSVEDMTVLIELFGRNKLQFLDFILGSSENSTDDPDNDESILSDIERLMHYHKDTLVTPSKMIADSPQEEIEKTRTLIALQNFELLLAKVRETFNKAKSDSSNTIRQENAFEAGKNKEISTEGQSSKVGYSSEGLDNNNPQDEWMGEYNKRSGKERESPESSPHIQAGPPQPQEGVVKQTLDFIYQIAEDSTTHIHAAGELLMMLTVQVVSSLPDDIRPGPDLYGVPWEPVIISSVVGLMTILLFTCRCYNSVKSRLYRSKERWMADQVAQLFDEKCKVLETLSKCQQEYDELESSLMDSSVLAQTQKTEHLQAKAKELENAKRELERDIEQLKDQLDQQREHRVEQERRIAVLEKSMKTFEEETKDLQSQDEQAQTTLKVYNMNSERLQRNLETAREENTLLQESNAQLRQQVEGWAERVSDMEAEMSRCEVTHSTMLQDVANKDERIMSLTDRLLRMKAWDSDLEEEEGEEEGEETSNGTAENGKGERVDAQGHLQKVQKLIYAAKLNADLKSVDEDKDRAFAKLNDEVKAKEDLLESIKDLEKEKSSLHSDNEHYSDQVQRLQQKLHIMTEMYQENELKLHRLLTVEEKERLQKEEKLNKADKNIAMALEELNNYRQRAQEMEEELEKTSQSYQVQMSAHEKKAHNNWLAARAADRELADIRRENGLLRQKLTDTQFKLDALDKDPYALSSLARPLPFRAERSPYGPSPLGRPASETRPFLSPPTLMDGPPARLSPRVPRGPLEPPGGQGEMERSGGPHSDSGSNSPTWERDRRGPPPGPPGPLGPPGYMFPEPGGPMYRRPPPPPAPLGYLPPPGPLHIRGLPPGPPHPAEMSDISYRENSIGPGEQEHREQSGPGDRRTPPETDPRMGGPPPPGPLMGPMDGPFPRRAPYGPPPPDFFPPRGPGGPPMMPMWNPPPPGMMFPPRFPPGGPPLPPVSHHAPPMRPPLPDGFPPPSVGPLPPQQSLPSPPHSQSPEEHRPSPEDAI